MGITFARGRRRRLAPTPLRMIALLPAAACLCAASCAGGQSGTAVVAADTEPEAVESTESSDAERGDSDVDDAESGHTSSGYSSATLPRQSDEWLETQLSDQAPRRGLALFGSAAAFDGRTWAVLDERLSVTNASGELTSVDLPAGFVPRIAEPGAEVLWVGGYFSDPGRYEENDYVPWGRWGIVAVQPEGSEFDVRVVFVVSETTATLTRDLMVSPQGTLMVLTSEPDSASLIRPWDERLLEISIDGEVLRSAELGALNYWPLGLNCRLVPVGDGGVQVWSHGVSGREVVAPFASDGEFASELAQVVGEGVVRFVRRTPAGSVELFLATFSDEDYSWLLPADLMVELSAEGAVLQEVALDPPVSAAPVRGSVEFVVIDDDRNVIIAE